MKNFIKSFSIEFTVAITILSLTLFFQYRNDESSYAKRSIDCWEQIDFIDIDTNETKALGLEFTHNGKEILGLSTANIGLCNYSDRDFENIKVRIEITPEEGDSLRLMETTIWGPHGKSIGLKEIKDTSKKEKKGTLVFEYIIETANRADTAKDILFSAQYAIASMEKPKLEVTIDGMGITKGKHDYSHFQKPSFWEENKFYFYLFGGAIIFLVVYIKLIIFLINRRNKRWQEYLHKHLSEKINAGAVKYDADNIISAYQRISTNFDYHDMNPIIRKIRRVKPPEE